VLLKYTYRIF